MKSSQKSRATVPQRPMLKEGRKVGRKSVLCHWKRFASGRSENAGREGGREGSGEEPIGGKEGE